jgi:hypothetical protein
MNSLSLPPPVRSGPAAVVSYIRKSAQENRKLFIFKSQKTPGSLENTEKKIFAFYLNADFMRVCGIVTPDKASVYAVFSKLDKWLA